MLLNYLRYAPTHSQHYFWRLWYICILIRIKCDKNNSNNWQLQNQNTHSELQTEDKESLNYKCTTKLTATNAKQKQQQ
jgi:hypothetical protein